MSRSTFDKFPSFYRKRCFDGSRFSEGFTVWGKTNICSVCIRASLMPFNKTLNIATAKLDKLVILSELDRKLSEFFWHRKLSLTKTWKSTVKKEGTVSSFTCWRSKVDKTKCWICFNEGTKNWLYSHKIWIFPQLHSHDQTTCLLSDIIVPSFFSSFLLAYFSHFIQWSEHKTSLHH